MAAAAANPNTAAPLPCSLIREAIVRFDYLGGIGATTLRRLIRDNGFPAPIKLSERIVAWDRAAVVEWIATRPTSQDVKRDQAAVGGAK